MRGKVSLDQTRTEKPPLFLSSATDSLLIRARLRKLRNHSLTPSVCKISLVLRLGLDWKIKDLFGESELSVDFLLRDSKRGNVEETEEVKSWLIRKKVRKDSGRRKERGEIERERTR